MVTGAIFPFVNARPDVQKALRNSLSDESAPKWISFQESHLVHLRGMLYDYFRVPATRCARSFWRNIDISSETFSSLKAAAQCAPCVKCKSSAEYKSTCTLENCVTPVRKALVLRCLRKFFLAQLETDASWQTVFNRDVFAQLTDEITRVESEGIR